MALEEHHGKSPVSLIGTGVTIAVGVVAVIIAFDVLAWIAGWIFTVVKVAVVVGIVAVVARFLTWRRRPPRSTLT